MKARRYGIPIAMNNYLIIPIEEVKISGFEMGNHIGVFAECSPLGVIIETANKRWAVNLSGKPMNLEKLIESIGNYS